LGQRSTALVFIDDAEEQALSFLASRSNPRLYPEKLAIALHSPTVSDATRDLLANISIGLGIYTDELPAVFGEEFNGFVEAYSWNIDRYTASLVLTCSEYLETYQV
jgi:hypothetical protein